MDIGTFQDTALSGRIGNIADVIRANRGDSPLFTYIFTPIREAITDDATRQRLTAAGVDLGEAVAIGIPPERVRATRVAGKRGSSGPHKWTEVSSAIQSTK